MTVESVRINLATQQRVVILKAQKEEQVPNASEASLPTLLDVESGTKPPDATSDTEQNNE